LRGGAGTVVMASYAGHMIFHLTLLMISRPVQGCRRRRPGTRQRWI
jgi:hypothetical protein